MTQWRNTLVKNWYFFLANAYISVVLWGSEDGYKDYTLKVSKGINMLNYNGKKEVCPPPLAVPTIFNLWHKTPQLYVHKREKRQFPYVKRRPSRSKLGMDCALTLSCHFK